MDALLGRIAGYGLAATLVGGLVYVGFVREVDPDLLTMVSSAEVQLRMASALPATTPDGQPNPKRAALIATARDYVERIERQAPELPEGRVLRARLAYCEGQYERAAGLLEQVRGLAGCSPMLRDWTIINQARILRRAGHGSEALALLQRHRDAMRPESKDAVLHELAQCGGGEAAAVGGAAAPPAGN